MVIGRINYGRLESHQVEGNRVHATLNVNGIEMSNPSIEDLKGSDWKEVLYSYQTSGSEVDTYEETDTTITVFPAYYYPTQEEPEEDVFAPEPILRVVQANSFLKGKSIDEIKATDITLLENLHKVSLKTRGYIYATKYYLEPEQLNLAFEILYNEIKDANKYTIGQTRTFNWYDENGALKITKSMSESFNAVQSASHEYNKRVARCLYLKYPEGEFMSNPQVKWAIDYLNKRYEAEVLDYERNNTDALHQRIINETDPTALQILNTVVEGQTFRDRILYIVVDDYIIG